MWNIKTNSNSTSRQETLAEPPDGANTSAAPSNTQLHCVSGQNFEIYFSNRDFSWELCQLVKLALSTTVADIKLEGGLILVLEKYDPS